MSMHLQGDRLEIVNGPEDGIAFSLTGAAADIGCDPACAVVIRFDRGVAPRHARAMVAADGYRIRRRAGGLVHVNGRRAGVIRSRKLRHGDMLRVGSTYLCLQCAPEGLARRSRGRVLDSDALWAARVAGGKLRLAVRVLYRVARGMLGRMAGLLLTGSALLMLALWLRPGWVQWLRYWAEQALAQLRGLLG